MVLTLEVIHRSPTQNHLLKVIDIEKQVSDN